MLMILRYHGPDKLFYANYRWILIWIKFRERFNGT
jgi:hypothetical protein